MKFLLTPPAYVPISFHWITTLAFLFVALMARTAEVIGTNALISYTDDIHFSENVHMNPGNGEAVDLNPPIFTWLYSSNSTGTETNMFTFQCSYSNSFAAPAVHIITPLNYYNFIDHFDTNISRTIYWRVGYTPASALTTTNWSTGTRTFTIAHGAPYWDRGMYADDNWLDTNGATHPKLWVRQGQGSNVWQFFSTNSFSPFPDFSGVLGTLTNIVLAFLDDNWWTNPSPTNLETNNAGLFPSYYLNAAYAGWFWQISGNTNAALTNYANGVMNSLATNTLKIKRHKTWTWSDNDPIYFGTAFDSFYALLDSTTRSNCLQVMVENMDFCYTNAAPGVYFPFAHEGDRGDVYSWQVGVGSTFKRDEDHGGIYFANLGYYALAAMSSEPRAKRFFTAWLNYYLTTTSHNADLHGGYDKGRSHGDYWIPDILVNSLTPIMVAWPNHGWTNHFSKYSLDWAQFFGPVGYGLQGNDTWGDGGWGGNLNSSGPFAGYMTTRSVGFDFLATVFQNPQAKYHGLAAKGFKAHSNPDGENKLFRLAAYPYLPNVTTNILTNTSAAFPNQGWAMGYSKSPSSYETFSNGVAFILKAQPGTPDKNHQMVCNNDFEAWAYGARITFGGGSSPVSWGGKYGFTTASRNVPMIDGQAQAVEQQLPNYTVTNATHAKLLAFQQGSNYVYALGEAKESYWAFDAANSWGYAAGAPWVTKAQRHLLFMRGKYFVIIDDLGSRSNSTYASPWHLMQSPAFDVTDHGFKYTSTNLFTGRSSVTCIVEHIAFTNTLKSTNITTSWKTHPWGLGADMTVSGSLEWRTNILYYTNSVAATNWHFMTVIYPVYAGTSLPTITRLSDNTVAVTNGSDGDVISFGETNALSTLILNMNAASGESANLSPVSRTTIGTIRAGGTR